MTGVMSAGRRPSAAVFDLDGLLIDSEPLWREAERAVFSTVGIELTDEMCKQTMGLRIDRVVEYWDARFGIGGRSIDELADAIVDEVALLMRQRGQPMPGVADILDLLRDRGIRLGLASSSPRRLIEVAVTTLEIADRFVTLHSALDETNGKPHPDVYLSAARSLGVAPQDCLAFEDSLPGVRSALAAGMTVVAVPAAEDYGDPAFDAAHRKIASLAAFRLD